MIRALVLASALLASGIPALAVQPGEVLKDPAMEARARQISAELRCLVCQNQSIDDSDAPLARDLRVLVRERLQAGDTDAGVREFLVARYGEFVLLKPRLHAGTALLWFTPLIVLGLGGLGLLLASRRRRAAVPALSADESRALDALLRREGAGS